MRIALVAGELSGDILGAAIIRGLKTRFPKAQYYGVAGPRMMEAGCEAIESIEALSVMGLSEVLRHLPRLFKLRATLVQRFLDDRPDVVIGIDAPDFNLGLETRLKKHGLCTVHVVSPTVWAWREGRVKTVARAVDRILCLFPFEQDFYRDRGVAATTIGHPLADQLDDTVTPAQGKAMLGLPADAPCVTIMPGSRGGELHYLADAFVGAAQKLAQRDPRMQFVLPVAKPSLRPRLEAAIRAHAPGLNWHVLDGGSRQAMQAADVVLLASGTATLECLLVGRPMVVSYRASAFTAWMLRSVGLIKINRVSLPNILSGQLIVPELLQEQATPELLSAAVAGLLADGGARHKQLDAFKTIRGSLRLNAGERAAEAIADLLKDDARRRG